LLEVVEEVFLQLTDRAVVQSEFSTRQDVLLFCHRILEASWLSRARNERLEGGEEEDEEKPDFKDHFRHGEVSQNAVVIGFCLACNRDLNV